MDQELKAFMEFWGNRFVKVLKERLASNYPYAPGSAGSQPELTIGDAYSKGRKAQYKGDGPKLASSALYNSISYQPEKNGFVLLMNDYWEYVNYGREAGHYVPITPLEIWASLKGFENPRSAAFGISRNIYKFGIAPTYFYDDALSILESQFNEELENQMDKNFNVFLNNLFQENLQ
jgi:hypothetical protein